MKRMLFNATQAEELRVAIVDGQKLVDLDIESSTKEQRKSNIYRGIITRIEPSLEAAFVDYGAERHGFLPFKEIARANFKSGVDVGRVSIQDAMREGQELIVQVEKDERGNKGAALTTFISLAGRYLVLMPNNPRGGGVSRRVEGEERDELRDTMAQLDVQQGMSIIARTAGIGRNLEELQWDLNYLLQLWTAIENAAPGMEKNEYLIFQEGSLVIRAIRDLFQPDIGEILIDTEEIYDQAVQFMSRVMPNNVGKVKLYKDDVPLFSRFQIEHQIESAYSREVTLPSGGAIVIDHTEALVSVDVNSARSTRGSDIEETAFRTNLEAAEEIARQLRLRDLGGLVVIDFIDMESNRNQREVEKRLTDALHLDRARVQMGKISRFGLLELSRQRLQPSLGETSHVVCPRCNGTGHMRGTESTALHILRIIQEEAMKESTAAVHAQIPVDVATFLLNEKRADIWKIEARFKVNVVLIPNLRLETPHYTVTRLKTDEVAEIDKPSYELASQPEETSAPEKVAAEAAAKPRQIAVVRDITPDAPAPMRAIVEPTQPSLLSTLKSWFGGIFAEEKVEAAPAPKRSPRPERDRGPRSRNQRDRQGRGPRPEGSQPRPPRTESARPAVAERPPAATAEAAPAAADGQERTKRPRRRGGRDRGDRPERTERDATQTAVANPVNTAELEAAPMPRQERPERGERPERSDRQQGRNRGRADRTERPPREAAASTDVTEIAAEATVQPMAASQIESPVFAAPETTPAPIAPTFIPNDAPAPVPVAQTSQAELPFAASQPAPSPVPVKDPEPQPEAPPAPVKEPPAPMPSQQPVPAAKPVDLAAAGLVMIETSSEKIAATSIIEQAANAPRDPRPKPAWAQKQAASNEPMQQVETRDA